MRRKKQTLWNLLNEFNPNEEISNAEYQVINRLMSEFMTYKKDNFRIDRKDVLIYDFQTKCQEFKNLYNDINIIQNLLLKEDNDIIQCSYKPNRNETIAKIEFLKNIFENIINPLKNNSYYVKDLLKIIELANFKKKHKQIFYSIGIEKKTKSNIAKEMSYTPRYIDLIVKEINEKLYNVADKSIIDYLIRQIILETYNKIYEIKPKNKKFEKVFNNRVDIIKELSSRIEQNSYIFFKTELGLEEIEKIKPKLII